MTEQKKPLEITFDSKQIEYLKLLYDAIRINEILTECEECYSPKCKNPNNGCVITQE